MKRIAHFLVPVSLALGFALAILLLVNSIVIYRLASRPAPRVTLAPATRIQRAMLRHSVNSPQFATLLAVDDPIHPLRRALLINSIAAVALLLSLALVALWLRSYMDARQSRRQFERSRRWKASLLPSMRQLNLQDLDVAADCVCSTEIKGDFYDAFSLQAGRAALILGDVGGPGPTTDLLLGTIHGIVRSTSWTESPTQHESATARINELLSARSQHRPASLFWSYFDPESRLLRFINAGHLPPLLFRAKRRQIARLEEAGPALGAMPDVSYRQNAARLEPGDVLVLYSDGIVDARDHAGEAFGEERLTTVVDLSRNLTAGEIRNRILSSVRTFTADAALPDDRTLLIMRYTPASPVMALQRQFTSAMAS